MIVHWHTCQKEIKKNTRDEKIHITADTVSIGQTNNGKKVVSVLTFVSHRRLYIIIVNQTTNVSFSILPPMRERLNCVNDAFPMATSLSMKGFAVQ